MIAENLLPLHEKMKTHLLTQKKRSISGGACRYRTETSKGTLMCAAGVLIPDSDYHHTMEFKAAAFIPFFQEKFNDEELNLILAYQTIHDNYTPSLWVKKIEQLENLGSKPFIVKYGQN
jgi:hypothetical protein